MKLCPQPPVRSVWIDKELQQEIAQDQAEGEHKDQKKHLSTKREGPALKQPKRGPKQMPNGVAGPLLG